MPRSSDNDRRIRRMKQVFRFLAPLTLGLFPRESLGGLRVIFTDLRVPRDRCLSALEQALQLLAATDSRNHRRVLRYTRYVVVWAGHYFTVDRRGGVHAAAPFLLEGDPAQVASLLVHEAVHLRIQRHGVRTTPSNIERVERRCTGEQADFLRRIPGDGEQWAADVEEALEDKWWNERSRREHVERLMHDLRMPRWLRPLVRTLQ